VVLDFRKANRAELVAGAAGVVLIVVMIALDWYGIRASGFIRGPAIHHGGVAEGFHRSAFESFTYLDVYLLLAALAAIALPLLKASDFDLPSSIPWDWIVGALGAIAVILIVVRLIDPPDLARVVGGVEVKASDYPENEVVTKIGPWLGLAAALVITAGGLMGASRRPPG
jgi:hypothetical protein